MLAALEFAGICSHHSFPKFLCHFCLPDAKATERHLMHRFLSVISIIAVHLKDSSLYANHLERHIIYYYRHIRVGFESASSADAFLAGFEQAAKKSSGAKR